MSNYGALKGFFGANCGKLTDKQKEYLSQSGNILSESSIITIVRLANGCILEDDIIDFINSVREKYNKIYIKERLEIYNCKFDTVLLVVHYMDRIWFTIPHLIDKRFIKYFFDMFK